MSTPVYCYRHRGMVLAFYANTVTSPPPFSDTKSTDYRRGLEKIYGPEVGRGAPRLLPPPSSSSSKSSSRKATVSYNLSYVPQFLNTSFKHLLGLAHWPYSIPTSRKSKPTKQMRDEGRVESVIWCPGSREEWDDCVEEVREQFMEGEGNNCCKR